MKKFRVNLVETVRYTVDVEAEDEDTAREAASELWAQSPNPTADFDGMGEGVESGTVWEDPPNWEASETGTDGRGRTYTGRSPA